MTTYDATLRDDGDNSDPVFGDRMTLTFTVTGLATSPDQTVSKAWLTVKSDLSDLDAAAELQMVITTVSSDDGQITDDGTGKTTATLQFTVGTAAHYTGLTSGRSYDYDVQVLLTGETLPDTIEKGTVRWQPEVTKAIA